MLPIGNINKGGTFIGTSLYRRRLLSFYREAFIAEGFYPLPRAIMHLHRMVVDNNISQRLHRNMIILAQFHGFFQTYWFFAAHSAISSVDANTQQIGNFINQCFVGRQWFLNQVEKQNRISFFFPLFLQRRKNSNYFAVLQQIKHFFFFLWIMQIRCFFTKNTCYCQNYLIILQ